MRVLAGLAVVLLAGLLWWLRAGEEPGPRVDRKGPAAAPAAPTTPVSPAPAPPSAPAGPKMRPAPPADAVPGEIAVVVRDAQGPVDGAVVELAPVAAALMPLDGVPPPRHTLTTDAAGRARVAAAPGHWLVRARRGAQVSFPVFTGVPSERELVLGDAVALHGEVRRPDGAPAAGAFLQFHFEVDGFSGFAGPAGTFRLPPVSADRWSRLSILVELHGLPRCRFAFARDELDGAPVVLRMTSVTVRGRVVDEAGAPVRASVVVADYRDPPVPTDEDGRFAFATQNAGAREYLVVAPGFVTRVWTPPLRAGDVKVKDPAIVVVRGRRLSGRVVDPDGAPVARAWVRLERHDRRGRIVRGEQAQTSGAGTFAFEAVGTEPHDLYAFREVLPDLALPQLRLERVEDGVEIVLPHPLVTTLRLSAPGAYPRLVVRAVATGEAVVVRDWAPWERPATLRFSVWEEGVYEVDLRTAGNARVTERVTVVRGRPRTLDVTLRPR